MNMNGYKVTIAHNRLHASGATESYGEWSESYSNTFESIEKIEKYPDLCSVEDLKIGDTVYVVWAEWSTGDSFGNADRYYTEALAVFSNSTDAVNMKNALMKSDGKGYNFVASIGQIFETEYAPWDGYFERLDEIHVTEAILE